MHWIDYLPIETIFNLLSCCRRAGEHQVQAISAELKQRGLRCLAGQPADPQRPIPRIDFWVRLCQAASLLGEGPDPFPTLLADEWLAWPYIEQMEHLLGAWVKAPADEGHCRIRKSMLRRLKYNKALSTTQQKELAGLQAIGICIGDRLSELGLALKSGADEQFSGILPAPWCIEGSHLSVPFPPDWSLLWELEKFLETAAPGTYLLTAPALRAAAQRGALQRSPTLPEVLERGLGEPAPIELSSLLAAEPVIRLIPGCVLEFSHPEELKMLRQSAGLRSELDHLLSPRHVALDPWRGYQVLQRLYHRGLLSEQDLPARQERDGGKEQGGLTKTDRAYLLSLVLLAEGCVTEIAPPPGLLDRLTQNMEHSLRAAAARKATIVLGRLSPKPTWLPEEDPRPPPDELVMWLQRAIDREESIDVMYQASGRHSAEYRHLSPLLVEPRGGRIYLIAYCHMRRANRTFRLDKLKLIEYPPL